MAQTGTDPIHQCIDRWHSHLRGQLDGGLDALLHADCVFVSPIVFTPQQGIDLTKMYLTAAGNTFGGDGTVVGDLAAAESGGFGYVREVVSGNDAVLEFETTVEGKYVNGVDMIHCDDDGMITEFKVMLRPLQAIELMHAKMKAMIEQLSG